MTGKTFTTIMISCIVCAALMFSQSCSRKEGQDESGRGKTAAASGKADTGKRQDPGAWVTYGKAQDGSDAFYDTSSVKRDPGSNTVSFWALATPPKGSKAYVSMQSQLQKEGKDTGSLHSFKSFIEANCTAMTYDMTKVVLLKEDLSPISQVSTNVRGRKPGGEMKDLIEKLCSGSEPQSSQAALPPPPAPPGSQTDSRQSGASGPKTEAAPVKALPVPASTKKSPDKCTGAGGGIMVLIQPSEAVAAGAQWRIEGGEWKNSGEKVCNLPVDKLTKKGLYRIEYKDIEKPEFITPSPHDANISEEYEYSFYNTLYATRKKDQKK